MKPEELIELVKTVVKEVQRFPVTSPRDRSGFLTGLAYAFAQHDGLTAEQFLTDARTTTTAPLTEQLQATTETLRLLEASEGKPSLADEAQRMLDSAAAGMLINRGELERFAIRCIEASELGRRGMAVLKLGDFEQRRARALELATFIRTGESP